MTARFLRLFPVFLFLAFAGSPFSALAAHETTVADIIRMSQAGLSDETIFSFLRVNEIRIELTAEDMAALAEAGVSEDFINALIEYMGEPVVPVPESVYVAGPRYPVGFYGSYYYDPWYYRPWFYHDFSLAFYYGFSHIGGHFGHGFYSDFHGVGTGGHPGVTHVAGGHSSATHGSGAGHVGSYAGGAHGSGTLAVHGTSSSGRHAGVGHTSRSSSFGHRGASTRGASHSGYSSSRSHSVRGHQTYGGSSRSHGGRSHGRSGRSGGSHSRGGHSGGGHSSGGHSGGRGH